MEYLLQIGTHGVDYLQAPYALLLLEALGNDGVNLRDTDKSMCQWTDVEAGWEVYDYKIGICYDPTGQAREDITEWHVQATEKGLKALIALLEAALTRLTAEAFEDACRETNAQGVADEIRTEQENQVREIGHGHGWRNAAFTDADGGGPANGETIIVPDVLSDLGATVST